MTDLMSLLESVRTWWRRATPASEPPPAVFSIERNTPRVPAEYVSLYTYLEHRYASIVVLTFEQMEALLGFALPASARTERDWWTGAAVHTRSEERRVGKSVDLGGRRNIKKKKTEYILQMLQSQTERLA